MSHSTGREGWLGPEVLAAYEHVLCTADWTMASLAAEAGVDPERTGGLLDELVARGLVRPSQDDPDRLTAVAPKVGLRTISDGVEQELVEHYDFVRGVRRTLADLTDRFDEVREQRLRDRMEVLAGRDAAVRRIAELLHDTTSEVGTVVSTLPSEQALEQARTVDEELLGRGVAVRALFLEGHRRQSAPLRAYLQWISERGGQVRIAQLLPTRLMYFDRRTAVVALDPADTAVGALAVHAPGLVDLAVTLFDSVWAAARDLDHVAPRTAGEDAALSEVEATVLGLLAQGLKDESVARRTGLSLRSVRRVVSGLSDQLGAHSRFELGVIAHDRGLV